MTFEKGHIVPKEIRQKISLAHKDKHYSKLSEACKGRVPWNKGLTKETDERLKKIGIKISDARKGIVPWNRDLTGIYAKEALKKMSEGHKGKPTWNIGLKNCYSIEMIEKMRANRLKQVLPKKNTSIEVIIQNILRKISIEFETHYPILGQPDVFIKPNICIFADGCWFHQCPQCFPIRSSAPSVKDKPERDAKITEELKRQGYKVVRIWEHELKKLSEEEIIKKIRVAIGNGNDK